MIRLLAAEDSPLMRKLIAQAFADEPDFTVGFARDGAEALQMLPGFSPDVITLDLNMPRMDGLACLDRIMIDYPRPVVMVSSLTTEGADATLDAFRLGAVDFVAKPDGAISLRMDQWGPALVATVRAAAAAKPRASLRLGERVRRRLGAHVMRRALEGPGLVLVGTSTGGPPALETLLSALPGDFPWPIVIAQHMPASFTGALAARLDRLCALTVTEVARATSLVPGHAYIGQGDGDIIVRARPDGPWAQPAPRDPGWPWHPSADRLVRSALAALPAGNLVGVLMTGMGNDGAAAMAALQAQGGRTIAEAEETAVVWGMPGALVKAGGASAVEPLDAIAARLLTFVPRGQPACP